MASHSELIRPPSFRPEIDVLGTTNRVLVEQVGAIDASRLVALAGHVSPCWRSAADEDGGARHWHEAVEERGDVHGVRTQPCEAGCSGT
jgi:hypothetical protein